MSRFRVLVVDDEPLARELLLDLLAGDPELEVLGSCGDGVEALAQMRRLRPDIVFLDVEMPEKGGIEVALDLAPEELPALVFVTAYGHYAIPAFEVQAIDYLLKPFSDQRFAEALERAKRRVRERRLGELAGRMAALAGELEASSVGAKAISAEPTGYLERLAVKVGQRSLVIKTTEIVWIESDDYYVRLHTAAARHLLRASLAHLEERLDPRRFVRIHRRAIVNLDEVQAVEQLTRGARRVVLSDGSRLPISRSRLKRVEAQLLPRLGGGLGSGNAQ